MNSERLIGSAPGDPPKRSGITTLIAENEERLLPLNNRDRHGRIIEVFVTHECPVMCTHCVSDSGGKMRGDTSPRDMEKVIREAAADHRVERIDFCGGEPFAAYDVLKFALELSHRLGLKNNLMTSNNWSTSRERARELFEPIAPFVDIAYVSTDVYHQRRVPLEHVRTGLEVILECGCDAVLLTSLNSRQMGERGEGRLFCEKVRALAEDLNIAYHAWPLLDIGRAIRLGNDVAQLRADQPCGLLTKPNFFSHGESHACGCGVALFKHGHPLHLGDFTGKTVTEIIDRASRSLIVQGLRAIGPVKMLELIGEKTDGFRTQCTACRYLNSRENVEPRIQAAMAEHPEVLNYIEEFRRCSGDIDPHDHYHAFKPEAAHVPT